MSTNGLSFAASAADVWTVCDGSPQLTARCDFVEERGERAEKGTLAHQFNGLYLMGKTNLPVVDDEVLEAAEIFKKHAESVLSQCTSGNQVLLHGAIEYPVQLSWLIPGYPIQYVDLRHYDAGSKTLYLWDFKFGHHSVQAEMNRQCMTYSLDGATKDVVEQVVIFIVQPFDYKSSTRVKEWRFDKSHWLLWAAHVRQSWENGHKPDAQLIPGNHCGNCKARGMCPAFWEEINELATVLDAPPSLTAEEVGERLSLAEKLLQRSTEAKSALHSQAMHIVKSGASVPGHKLVNKPVNRRLKADQLASLAPIYGVNPEDMFKKTLKPLSELEKMFNPDVINMCSEKPPGALVLVPDTDSRNGFSNKAESVFGKFEG